MDAVLSVVLQSLLFVGGSANVDVAGAPWKVVAEHGIVVTDHAQASQAGASILENGGNAIDAAAAASFALGVTRGYNSGLGGGGFLMVRLARTGEVFILDYRETAPGAARPDMFVRARERHPDRPAPSQVGGLAVGVPGLVAGHATLLKRFGTRSLKEVIEPARRLAAEGFPLDEPYLGVVRDVLRRVDTYRSIQSWTEALRRGLLLDGKALAPGAVLKQPELAATLQAIADGGADEFYRGNIARQIVRSVQAAGGVMTAEDLAGYQPVWREALRSSYRGYELFLMPPPSSGGVCLAESLNILEHWDMSATRKRDPGLATHLTIEALKQAFADRARYLGDADYAAVPVARLVSKEHAARLTKAIREDRTTQPAGDALKPPDDAGTTHFCVADRWGNIVSATETINTAFGSLLVADGTGIVLNNEMDDFTAEPGRPNAFGLQQGSANAVQPHKRPLSCMSPTIVLSGGKPVLAVGASGGPRIISATLQVILNVLDYRMPLDEAVASPRLHHQWLPDTVYRNGMPEDIAAGLRRRGHQVSDEKREAIVQALQIWGGRLVGASDPRKGGRPAGY